MFELLGRFHVALVHFPIALLLVGGVLELTNRRRADPTRASAARLCIALGAASAVISSVTGWIHADCIDSGSSVANTLLLHRWLGIATALFACAAVMFGAAAQVSATAAKMRLASVFCAAVLVGVTGHFGGTLVYGPNFYLSAFDDDEPVANVPNSSSPSPHAELAANALALLQSRCIECHGEKKQKGELRLDVLEKARTEDEFGFVIKRGDPAQSRLIQRISLPPDDEDHMPPKKSGPPLTPDEIELLRRWIEAGAPTS